MCMYIHLIGGSNAKSKESQDFGIMLF